MKRTIQYLLQVAALLTVAVSSIPAAAQAAQDVIGTANVGTLTVTAPIGGQNTGGPTTVSVNVSATDATGIVALLDGEEVVGWGHLANGLVTITLTTEQAPKHPLVAVYGGDSHYAAATSASTQQQVGNEQSAIVVSSVPTPDHEKEFATYTAKLADPTANGIVLFVLNGSLVGSAPVVNGTVSVVRGKGTMHIIYAGDDKHAPVSQ